MGFSGLRPLELTECLTDSPYFRDTLHCYEKELENTNASFKCMVKVIKELIAAAKRFSECQRAFASALESFHFSCIGSTLTDDESVICSSLQEFSRLVNSIENERVRLLDTECSQSVLALENFRATHIARVKEGRKKFEKQTQKFCTSLERHLNMSTKKHEDQVMKEADASLEMEQRCFVQTSMNYVCKLQEVEQRKKFDFVETLLAFVYGWLTFYHNGYELAQDSKPFMNDLQCRLQKAREEFEETHTKVESLKNKTLEERQTSSAISRQGYLFLMEKKAFGTTWAKHYCMYDKTDKLLTLIAFNQLNGKPNTSERIVVRLRSCVRRMSDSIDRRFCFDVSGHERDQQFTLQATSEQDRRLWLDAMDGKEPTYSKPGLDQNGECSSLDEGGFYFVNKCVAQLEGRGLEEQGLYRVVGVASKVSRLVQLGRCQTRFERSSLDSIVDWESKTITSALKTYFRNLPEPLMTHRLHSDFIAAAKKDNREERVNEVQKLVGKLPKINYRMLKTLMQHLTNVSAKCERNLMSVSNLAVCFGPTLLRPEEETMATIIDIKFCNIVVEILVRNFYNIFGGGFGPDLDAEMMDDATATPSGANFQQRSQVTNGNTPPPKSTIISATAQPVHVTCSDGAELSSTCSLVKPMRSPLSITPPNVTVPATPVAGVIGGGSTSTTRRQYAPPPYAHPPPPPPNVTADPPPQPLVTQGRGVLATSSVMPLHVCNPAAGVTHERCLSTSASDPGGGTSGASSSSCESLSSRSSREHTATVAPSIAAGGGSVSPRSKSQIGLHCPPSYRAHPELRVRTLYACVGENSTELSFEPNQIITNVRPSREPGWLQGTLNGHFGLVPDNYVEYLP